MAHHHAFRQPGGTGGINNMCEVAFGTCEWRPGRIRLLCRKRHLDAGFELARLLGKKLLRCEQHPSAGVGEDVLDLSRPQPFINVDGGATGGQHPEKSRGGLRAALEENSNPVAWVDATAE